MSASTRLKQMLRLIAALALVGLGLVSLSTMPAAQATDTEPCEEVQGGYTEWAQTGTVVQHGDASAPGANTDVKEYRGPTPGSEPHVIQEGTEGTPAQDTRVWWIFRGSNGAAAPADDSGLWRAQPNLPADQSQHSYPGENGLGEPYQPGADSGNGDWFRFTGELIPAVEGTPRISHTDYTWTVWEREFVEPVDCPDPPVCPEGTDNVGDVIPEGETEESFCNDEEEGPAVCHPVEGNGELGNGWNLISPNQASSHIDEALFPSGEYWQHETSDGRHDIYSEDGVNCPDPEEPAVCPEGTDNVGDVIPEGETEESFCNDEEPAICPEGTDNAGDVIPEGKDAEEFCNDEEPAVCPEGTDKAGDEIPEGKDAEEFCEDDDDDEVCPEGTDNAGQEIPGGKDAEEFCNDDPIIGPGEGESPGNNNPGNSPGNSPSSNPGNNAQGSNLPNNPVTPALAPGAQVPSAVAAGLAPTERELTGAGGLGLIGVGISLLGLGLVGLTLRPRHGRRLAG